MGRLGLPRRRPRQPDRPRLPVNVGVAGGATDATTPHGGLAGRGAASPNFAVNLPAPVGTGSGGALGLTLGSVDGAFNLNLRLSALENTGQVRILSSPRITTLDNIEASIEQGVSIPISVVSAAGIQTVFVDAKLNLTVKPHVTNDGTVIMNVNVTRNEPDFVNTGARGDPTILKKEAKTEMLVRDGDTAVIGGIYTRNTGLSLHQGAVLRRPPDPRLLLPEPPRERRPHRVPGLHHAAHRQLGEAPDAPCAIAASDMAKEQSLRAARLPTLRRSS